MFSNNEQLMIDCANVFTLEILQRLNKNGHTVFECADGKVAKVFVER